MENRERKIMVAVDESEESMYALSWSITNLISETNNNSKLMLLYVKPPSAVYSLDSPGSFLHTPYFVTGRMINH
jgi:hypothetical protein